MMMMMMMCCLHRVVSKNIMRKMVFFLASNALQELHVTFRAQSFQYYRTLTFPLPTPPHSRTLPRHFGHTRCVLGSVGYY